MPSRSGHHDLPHSDHDAAARTRRVTRTFTHRGPARPARTKTAP
ncbi:hypothetical protein QJS66_08745 [Kocuria rhizophila]|nr:hypothetical protein QJS66_08745 [Kocuria rhizophila]